MSDERQRDRVRVGIVGVGMVGTPIARWFQEVKGYQKGVDLFLFDENQRLGLRDDVNEADLIFVSVPTPHGEQGSCDTSIVETVVDGIADGKLVAIKSTVPPGTTWRLQQKYPKKLFLFNPEFLTESQAWADYIHPSRQIIGVTDETLSSAIEILNLLPQAPFSRPWAPIYGVRSVANSTEAELAKYMSNVFGAMKVWFFNMIANTCWAFNRLAQLEGDGPEAAFEQVRAMVAADQRTGPAWTQVDYGDYSGFGGFCFPKDFAAFKAEFLIKVDRLRALVRVTGKQDLDRSDRAMLNVLEKDLTVLQAIWNANEALLEAQGLSIPDVSYHDKELVLRKHQPIRLMA